VVAYAPSAIADGAFASHLARMVHMGDELLTLAEAAELLGFQNKRPSASVANLIRRGHLPGVLEAAGSRSGGRGCWRVWRSDVLAYRVTVAQRAERMLQRETARLARLERTQRRAS